MSAGPKMNASPTPEDIQDALDEYVSHSFKDRASRCVDDVIPFAAEGLRLADEYDQLTRTLEVLVPDEGYRGDAAEILNALYEKVGLAVVHNCLGGVAERANDAIGGYVGESGLARCKEYVKEHLKEAGPPEAKSTPFRLENLERWCDAIEERITYEHKRIDELMSGTFTDAIRDALTTAERSTAEGTSGDDSTELNDDTSRDADCEPCSRRWFLSQEHHDWLLSFEQRGLPGAVELMQYLEINSEGEGPKGLGWVDFPTFVAMHNWQDPDAVQSLASMVDDAIRARKTSRTATSRLDAVGILAQGEDV